MHSATIGTCSNVMAELLQAVVFARVWPGLVRMIGRVPVQIWIMFPGYGYKYQHQYDNQCYGHAYASTRTRIRNRLLVYRQETLERRRPTGAEGQGPIRGRGPGPQVGKMLRMSRPNSVACQVLLRRSNAWDWCERIRA